MDKTLLAQLTQALQDEQGKLEAEINKITHRGVDGAVATDFPNHGESEDENAAEVAEFSDNLSLESELEAGLKDIRSAQKAIEAGTYGKCKYCQHEIDIQRLLARPASTSCIACKKTLTQEI
ncbi:TPA: hypothetical protein DEP96_01430 [Candidatus Uhrbacteria bacterium]|nr:hypothetical protein [Candidatus Uhrbacteria bacterium]